MGLYEGCYITLARAIQLGLLSMGDLDKPVVDFMPEIDRSKIKSGVDTITLRDALYMKSGLRFPEKLIERKLGDKYSRQQYFQKLFELTAPVTPESKEYKYTGTDPSMIMMLIDIKALGTVQEFNESRVGSEAQGPTSSAGASVLNIGEGDIRITSVLETNSLLIQATQSQYNSILAAIERIDI